MTGKSRRKGRRRQASNVPAVEMNFQLFREDMASLGWEEADLVKASRSNAMRVNRFMTGAYRTTHTWALFAAALAKAGAFEPGDSEPVARYVVRSAVAA